MEYLTERVAFAVGEGFTVSEANYPYSPYNSMGFDFDAERVACASITESNKGHYQEYPASLDYNQLQMASKRHGDSVIAAFGDGHAKNRKSASVIYNIDTDPSGSHGGCEVAHFMQYGYYSNNVPTGTDLERLKMWGKWWDGSW
jgi:prepilin-type processing-associated H-X9-DG protein